MRSGGLIFWLSLLLAPVELAAESRSRTILYLDRSDLRESRLRPGSELRFRGFSFWEAYHLQSIPIAVVLLIQATSISILLHERKERNDAEKEARSRMLLSISDSGLVIPTEKLADVFDPFFTTKRQRLGHGPFHSRHHCSGSQAEDLGGELAGSWRRISGS